jgi:hypothetical protein
MRTTAMIKIAGWILLGWGILVPAAVEGSQAGASTLNSLLPRVAGWTRAEEIQQYRAETLYEYIDGAAEAYIGYDFKELVVGQFRADGSKAQVTAEIYDMGTPLNAFGIYSVERFPESLFLDIGVQGYIEEGSLNFLAGRYYVKMLCYEGGGKTDSILKSFAADITGKLKEIGSLPALLRIFPKDGRIVNSEKFILRNFLGFKFLGGGYMAGFNQAGQDFEAFLIEAKSEADAGSMFARYVDNFAKSGRAAEKKPYGIHLKDSYLKNVFAAHSGRYVCGIIKIKDGGETLGEKYLELMVTALKARGKI